MNIRHRPLAVSALALVAAGGLAVGATYPRVGRATLAFSLALEARRGGLKSRVVDVDGLPVTTYEGGPRDAPTVVMLHGYSADRAVWVRFAQHLSKDHHVVIPDLAGHGATPHVPGADYSPPAQAARVVGVLDALGVERAHVIGNSMGGFVAAWFALEHPERTVSVGLSDAAGLTSPTPSELDELLERGENPFVLTHVRDFPRFYAMTMARPPFVPGFVRHAMAADYVERAESLAEILAGFRFGFLLDGRLGEIAAPAYVMWGTEDRIVDPSAARVWAEGLPDATLVTYDGIGHMPMLEIPRRSAADYRAFLADLGARHGVVVPE
ncbi:alpha/beta fold hydrolase [soil metagenome]